MAPTAPFKTVTLVLVEVEIGDLIEFRRTGYTHWAVYVGDGFAIHVDLPAYGHTHATIRKELLVNIAGNDRCRVNNLAERASRKGLSARTSSEIVSTAESQVGTIIEYRLLSENCEYFATSCRYGEEVAFSAQVDTASESLISYGTGAAIVGAVAAGLGYLIRSSANSQRSNRPNRR